MYGNVRQYMAIYNNIWQCTTMYGNVRQYMAMYNNVWQCTAMCGNLPSPEIQSGTIWYYHDLYRNSKEGRKEKCVYGCSNCMVVRH